MTSKRKTKTQTKASALRKLREAKSVAPVKAKPKAKPAPQTRAKPSAPSSIASISPTRYPREIKLDKVIKRHDMGDITGLAKSIDDRGGLISPVCIDPSNFLIAGQRRLAAWAISEKFRKEPIPVNVLDVDNILAGEWDENAKRKNFTPEESVEIMDALEPQAMKAARARMAHGKTAPGRKAKDGVVVDASEKGSAADHVARYLGRDRKTLNRAKEVIVAARASPKDKKLGELVSYMNRTGKVNGPWKRLQMLQQRSAIEDKKKNGKLDLPGGKFDRIVADVPWAYEPEDENSRANQRSVRAYPTMSQTVMCEMAPEIKKRLAANCVLFFWTTNYHMRYAYEVLQAWGFEKFPTILTWRKDKIGRGQWLRDQTEHCIIAVRGKPAWNLDAQSTVFDGPRRENSQKPDEFYALIDALAPAQRSLELFARRELPEGWEGFGDQVGTIKDAAPAAEQKPLTELEALETVDNEQPLSGVQLATLKGQKLVRGSVKLRLTKAGIVRLAELRREAAIIANPDDHETFGNISRGLLRVLGAIERGEPISFNENDHVIQGLFTGKRVRRLTKSGIAKLAELRAAADNQQGDLEDMLKVDCRVCGTGNGLCAECLPADAHVFTMTTDQETGWEVGTCSCGQDYTFPRSEHRNLDEAIKLHWQVVVAAAKKEHPVSAEAA